MFINKKGQGSTVLPEKSVYVQDSTPRFNDDLNNFCVTVINLSGYKQSAVDDIALNYNE